MKRKLWIGALIMICVAIAATGTIAYITREKTVRNVITSGQITMELVEQREEQGKWLPLSQEEIRVKPGLTVSKRVAVENTEESAWVRVKCEIICHDANNEPMELDKELLESLILMDMNTEDWICKDGWWYYQKSLEKGDRTDILMDSITFSSAMGNVFQGSTIRFEVSAQAVQTANNGSNVWEAAGWE